jgi:dTDP-4-amino-4,6-dideoxygalactose transaminase
MSDIYKPVRDFEDAIASFTGSPYAVAVDSCTNALFLCCKYLKVAEVTIPCKTYVSVPSAIIHAGGRVVLEKSDWEGLYQLKPYPIFDSACMLAKDSYVPGNFLCLSFSANKPLNIGKGGMILTDRPEAARWFKLARYEGREEMDLADQRDIEVLGWNMYMTPEQAARGRVLLSYLPSFNRVKRIYPDLSRFEIFRNHASSAAESTSG